MRNSIKIIKAQFSGEKDEDLEFKILRFLLKEKGIEEYRLFYVVEEGEFLPGGVENISGCVLTKEGKIYEFWLHWDENKTAPDGSKGYYSLGDNYIDPYTGERKNWFFEIPLEEYQRFQEKLEKNEKDDEFVRSAKELGVKKLSPSSQVFAFEKRKKKAKRIIIKLLKEKINKKIIIFERSIDPSILSEKIFKESGSFLTQEGKIYHYEFSWKIEKNNLDSSKERSLELKVKEIPFEEYARYQLMIEENPRSSLKQAMKKLNVKKLYPFREKSLEVLRKEREEKSKKIIKDLLKEKRIKEFVIFRKGYLPEDLPGGISKEEGYFLTKKGRVYYYILLWDKDKFSPEGKKGYYEIILYELNLPAYIEYQEEMDEDLKSAMKKLKIAKLYPLQKYSKKEIYKILERQQKRVEKILRVLLHQKGIIEKDEKFIVFEKEYTNFNLPGNIPQQGGFLLTKKGKIFLYCLDWDRKKISSKGEKGFSSLKRKADFFPYYSGEACQKDYLLYQEEIDGNEETEFAEAAKKLGVKKLYPFREEKE